MDQGTEQVRLGKWDGIFRQEEVYVPSSKSIANRALIIQALSPGMKISGISAAKDTQTLQNVLEQLPQHMDVGPAGTPFRFLLSFLAQNAKFNGVLTGSARMQERPIGDLVDALKMLGANIAYSHKKGYPPVAITGTTLVGGLVHMKADISSQFVSSLLLIGPTLAKGLEIHFDSEPVSKPYINMTMETMRFFGAKVSWINNGVKVEPGGYASGEIEVESCWSSVSYFLGLVALAKQGEKLRFKGFRAQSSQGDAVLQSIMPHFGVDLVFENGDLVVWNTGITPGFTEELNCEDFPDLAQTLIALACFKGVDIHLSGLKTLRIKETDRIQAMVQELGKLGYVVHCTADSMHYSGTRKEKEIAFIETYHDHRVAMACAMGIGVVDGLCIGDPQVVDKSFPDFFDQLSRVTGV